MLRYLKQHLQSWSARRWYRPRWQAAGASDVGRVRRENQDRYLVDPARGLFLLADGMGGHRGGATAAELAVTTVDRLCSAKAMGRVAGDRLATDHLLATAFRRAHETIAAAAAGDHRLQGMGTTLVAAVGEPGGLAVYHVGDSRAYRLAADGVLHRLTRDHTAPGRSHVLSRALGLGDAGDPDCRRTALAMADRFLLCSDGLWNLVADAAIAAILGAAATPEAAAAGLVAAANEAGGLDNVTVVCGWPAT